jgi:AcrR family transcriptional regulator
MAAGKSLTRAQILAAAAAVADADGVEAVTMRRVGARLGVEAMSLYHHVRGKAALLDGLVDRIVAEIEAEIRGDSPHATPDGDESWRDVVRGRSLAARRVMLAHPWAPGVIGSRGGVPGSIFGLYEEALGAMVRGGCSYRLAHRAMHALGSLLLGFTQELFSAPAAGTTDDRGDEASEAEFAAMAGVLPYTMAMLAAETHAVDDPTLGWCDSQTEFEVTLDLLLDGIERTRLAEATQRA